MPTAAEQALLAAIKPIDFDVRMTNIQTDKECWIEDWLQQRVKKKSATGSTIYIPRKHIICLPEDFPIEMLCAAVWEHSKQPKTVFDLVGSVSAENLNRFKKRDGSFDWPAYFDSITYVGSAEKFLLLVKPGQAPDPAVYAALFGSSSSVIILTHQFALLRDFNVPDVSRYVFFRYTDSTTEKLLGRGGKVLERDGGFEQQSLDAMVMSVSLRKKGALGSCQSQFELARACLESSRLPPDRIKCLERVAYQNISALQGGVLNKDAIPAADLPGLLSSGLIQLQSDDNRYYFMCRTLHRYLAARYVAAHPETLAELLKTYQNNIAVLRVVPILYWIRLSTRSATADTLKGFLQDKSLPDEVKAECCQFFSTPRDSGAVVEFFCGHPEFRQYLPHDMGEAYRVELEKLQQRRAQQPSHPVPNLFPVTTSHRALPVATATLPVVASAPSVVASSMPKAATPTPPKAATPPKAGSSSPVSTLFAAQSIELELGTDDVQYYLDAKIRQVCDGYRLRPDGIDSYLLRGDRLVAVLPPTETSGQYPGVAFAAIDFYLDGSEPGGDGRSAYLHKMMTEGGGNYHDNFAILKEFDKDTLTASINSLMGEGILDQGAISSVFNIIQRSQFTDSLMSEIATIKIAPDVFTELDQMAHFFQAGQEQQCKILFPFNLGNNHWVSVEINIHKTGRQYNCAVFLHDPKVVGSRLSVVHFEKVKLALEKRIKNYDPDSDVVVRDEMSPYLDARQAKDNGIDCGLYAVCDIMERIADKPLVPSAQSPLVLRQEIVDVMQLAVTRLREAQDSRVCAVERCIKQNDRRLLRYQHLYGQHCVPPSPASKIA